MASFRVLLVSRSFPAHRPGGLEWHSQDVMEGLMEAGHEVHVLTTPLPNSPALKPLKPNGSVQTVGNASGGEYDLGFFRQLPGVAADICEEHSISLIHAQGFAGIPLVLSPRSLPSVVTTIHGTLWSETPLDRRSRRDRSLKDRIADVWRLKHRFAFWPLWRAFLAKNPALVVDSKFTERELRRENKKLHPKVVPLGMDFSRFDERDTGLFVSTQSELGRAIAAPGVMFFTYGRLEPIKGFSDLIHACSRLPQDKPWRLVIGGAGPDRANLEALSRKLGLTERVLFLGRVADNHLARWLDASDVVLNPDHGQPAFGLTLVEALVEGVPVIASKVGAHPEIVLANDGVLVPAGKPGAWEKALRWALDHLPERPEARERRKQRARERFDRKVMVNRLVEVYRAAVKAS